jgi:hypothetical protein
MKGPPAWLWPAPVRGACWRKNALLCVRVRAGRVRLGWAVPLFLLDDLLAGAATYAWLARRFLPPGVAPWVARALPWWRQLRWAGPLRLLEVSQGDVRVVVRLL